MIKEPGYRLNVGLIILNHKGKLLLCKRKNENSWQFPQGGIDPGETPYEAAKRELFEEVGIRASSVSLIDSIDEWVKYEIPEESRRKRFLKKKIKGQKQKWYMFKLKEDVIISFDNDPDNEFEEFKWVTYWYPLHVIIKFKANVYRKVLNELRLIYSEEETID